MKVTYNQLQDLLHFNLTKKEQKFINVQLWWMTNNSYNDVDLKDEELDKFIKLINRITKKYTLPKSFEV